MSAHPHPFLAGGKRGPGCHSSGGNRLLRPGMEEEHRRVRGSAAAWAHRSPDFGWPGRMKYRSRPSRRHRVYAFDMFGHGLTDKPRKNCYAIADLARFTLALPVGAGRRQRSFHRKFARRPHSPRMRASRSGARKIHGPCRTCRNRARDCARHAPCECAGPWRTPDAPPAAWGPGLDARVSRPVICHERPCRNQIRARPRAGCASGGPQNAAESGLGQRISDRARRGSAGRHADIAAAYPDHLGTTGQACAAGSRPHSRSEIAAIKNDPL